MQLETLRNGDGIEEDDVSDNAIQSTVSQCFNHNLKSPLYLAVSWLNSPVLFTFLQREKLILTIFSELEGL